MRRSRKSGLKSKNPNAGSKFKGLEPEPIDISYDNYDTWQDLDDLTDIRNTIQTRIAKKNQKHAYIITYVGEPDLLYVAFTNTGDKARGEATKYYKGFHPKFTGTQWREKHITGRRKKAPEFDKYIEMGGVPILEVMKIGAKLPCSVCREHMFTYEDYEDRKFVVVEGEGGAIPNTNGYILCLKCQHNILK